MGTLTSYHPPPIVVVLLTTIILSSSSLSCSSSSYPTHVLTRGSSLHVENKDELLVSPNGLFTAGFHPVGENAYVFAVWFTNDRTVVWMANRDAPVNGEKSKLSLWKHGNLVLLDAGRYTIWSTQTESKSSLVQLTLLSSGNLVLQQQEQILWQSFDHPTDTLLPNQPFTKSTQLVSSRSSSNCSTGNYKLMFDNDSILRLVLSSPQTTSQYWPDPRMKTYLLGRFQYLDGRTAILDSYGQFNSTDGFSFTSNDYGPGPQRLIRLDTDGNLRAYSLVRGSMKWEIQFQAILFICRIDGTCGPNSLCTYVPDSGKKCSCIHGYKMVNPQDWSFGCEPEVVSVCNAKKENCDFIELKYTEFYGYDIRFHLNASLDTCKADCLHDDECSGFNFSWKNDGGYYFCFLKSSLRNGYQVGVYGTMYIKLPKRLVSSFNQTTVGKSSFSCPQPVVKPLMRPYKKINDTKSLGSLLVVACVIGFVEIICIVVFWYYSSKQSSTTKQMYFPASTGFRKFTYSELKNATHNFSEEIGRGGGSIVYKAWLEDQRIAAIKKLKDNNDQGEDEFQAEISTIGRMNHMNLIETWGYCAEGKHRLIVYEYMERGSLAYNLGLDKLNWATRFNIITGTAKGLAYLHEECLEWILHCDVKPHNILLDANYNPKVADFGLSKRSERSGSGSDQCDFSMMRGTRGYMAPEWVLNLPITSKVDVFSYGVVMLEIITGRSPARKNTNNGNENGASLIHWVRTWVRIEDIVDPSIRDEYDPVMMEELVRIALQCTEEESEVRPTMSQIVNMLLHM